MKYFLSLAALLSIHLLVNGKSTKDSNLINNGHFELGNTGFSSDFEFSSSYVQPGFYSIAKNVESLHPDFKSPRYGDHTTGQGRFMVINSNDQKGMKAWKTRVKVIPNSMYQFSVYFCNVYKEQESNFGLMLNGMAPETSPLGNVPNLKVSINRSIVLEDERDIFHTFGWLRTEVVWYSGQASGEVEISIENANSKSLGNDLAIDDISLYYIKTMEPGYKPHMNRTELSAEYREAERLKRQPDPRKFLALNNLAKGDSIAEGIYYINRPGNRLTADIQEFNPILFEQGKSDLSLDAKLELDSLSIYLISNIHLKIQLRGHTENIGNSDLNYKLSEERSLKVKEYLISKGVKGYRMQLSSFGGTQPVENKDIEEFRRLNRRVEIILTK